MARLTTYVHVTDEEHGTVVFGPDSDVPAWARKAITNPKVWAESSDDSGDAVSEPADQTGGQADSDGAGDNDGETKQKPPSNAELEAEIERRNQGRDEADLIKPDSNKKADLVAALAADDQKPQA